MFYDFVTRSIAKVIGFVAPDYARKYALNHQILRAYTAAKTTGADRLYRPAQSSGAQETVNAWQTIADKARDLDRNNPYVSGMKKRFVAAVIGEGSWPRPKVFKGANKYDFDKELNNNILRRWENWADEACANGDNIYQLQRVAARHYFVDGAFLIRKVVRNKKLMLEGLEIDHLDTLKDTDPQMANGKGRRIVGGIELDEFNKPAAYWIKPRHPAEVETVSVREPAENVIHIFDRSRASDVNGICSFASVVTNLYSIGEYRASTMGLARVATGFGVFVESPYPQDFMQPVNGGEADTTGTEYQYVVPGGVHYLRPGEKIGQVKPENPSGNYNGFIRGELQAASVGAGMSYESISNDGSQSNFSSTRQMLLFERAMARYTHALFEEQFYSKIYKWFIEFEQDFGKPPLAMRGYANDKKRYLAVSWSRPKTEWVDPLKDVKSAAAEVDLGINTLTDLCETAGKDIEEVVATRQYENELLKAAGLTVEPVIVDTPEEEQMEVNSDAEQE